MIQLQQQLSDCGEEYCKEDESGDSGEEAGDVMEEWQFNTLTQLKEVCYGYYTDMCPCIVLKMNYRDQYKCLQVYTTIL